MNKYDVLREYLDQTNKLFWKTGDESLITSLKFYQSLWAYYYHYAYRKFENNNVRGFRCASLTAKRIQEIITTRMLGHYTRDYGDKSDPFWPQEDIRYFRKKTIKPIGNFVGYLHRDIYRCYRNWSQQEAMRQDGRLYHNEELSDKTKLMLEHFDLLESDLIGLQEAGGIAIENMYDPRADFSRYYKAPHDFIDGLSYPEYKDLLLRLADSIIEVLGDDNEYDVLMEKISSNDPKELQDYLSKYTDKQQLAITSAIQVAQRIGEKILHTNLKEKEE